MKCKLHGNHCCALCAIDDIKRGDQSAERKVIGVIFGLTIFFVALAIYY